MGHCQLIFSRNSKLIDIFYPHLSDLIFLAVTQMFYQYITWEYTSLWEATLGVFHLSSSLNISYAIGYLTMHSNDWLHSWITFNEYYNTPCVKSISPLMYYTNVSFFVRVVNLITSQSLQTRFFLEKRKYILPRAIFTKKTGFSLSCLVNVCSIFSSRKACCSIW